MGSSDKRQTGPFFFDGFALDAGRRTLNRHGVEVDLRAKGLDLLICLVRHAGRLVSKDELMATVWPDVVVSDESITRCVSDIRQALNDADQRIVKTVPRRGYVLVAPVSLTPPAPSFETASEIATEAPSTQATGPSTPPAAAPAIRSPVPPAAWMTLVAVVALATGGWALWVRAPSPFAAAAQRSSDAQPLSIAVLPLAMGGDDADEARLANGLTQDLTTDLARIPDSHVSAAGWRTPSRATSRRQTAAPSVVNWVCATSWMAACNA